MRDANRLHRHRRDLLRGGTAAAAPSSRFHMSIELSCDAETILPFPTFATASAASLWPQSVYCST